MKHKQIDRQLFGSDDSFGQQLSNRIWAKNPTGIELHNIWDLWLKENFLRGYHFYEMFKENV